MTPLLVIHKTEFFSLSSFVLSYKQFIFLNESNNVFYPILLPDLFSLYLLADSSCQTFLPVLNWNFDSHFLSGKTSIFGKTIVIEPKAQPSKCFINSTVTSTLFSPCNADLLNKKKELYDVTQF